MQDKKILINDFAMAIYDDVKITINLNELVEIRAKLISQYEFSKVFFHKNQNLEYEFYLKSKHKAKTIVFSIKIEIKPKMTLARVFAHNCSLK